MFAKQISAQTRTFFSSSIGTILEWYDFSLLAYLTPVLSVQFFPQDHPTTALMLTYAIFAVGFFVRPLGAFIFGHMGDKYGRKRILLWSILLMGLPTFCIGLLPTYSSIGIVAPILLIVLRICQGLSAGGESTGAILFVLESTSDKHRGVIGATLWTVVSIGLLSGSFASSLAIHAQATWAWRIPFLLGLLTGVVGYYLRRYTLESTQFMQVLQAKSTLKFPLLEGIKKYKREMLIILGIFILSAMITYIVFIFMPSFASTVVGLPLAQTSWINTLALMIEVALFPVAGYIADWYGRDKMMRYAALGFMLLSYPLFVLITQGNMPSFIIAQFMLMFLAVGFQSPLNATTFDLVPTNVRYSMIAVGYNLSYSIFGGTAPLVATYLVKLTGVQSALGWYLVAGASVAFVALSQIKKSK